MKWNLHKKYRTAALALAISAALTSSVFAMPTGGTVAQGTVSGLSNGTVVNGGTIATTNGAAIINWNAFGLLSNETLNFNTVNGALLNRVTGSQLSTIAGHLNQVGENALVLVNPNGIVVSGTGVINAQQLVLSTLPVTDTQINDLLEGKTITMTGGKNGITVQSGANINATQYLHMYGNTIQVDDNVTFSQNPVNNESAMDGVYSFVAAPDVSVSYDDNVGAYVSGFANATKDNILALGNNDYLPSGMTFANLYGGSVTLGNAKNAGQAKFYQIGDFDVDVMAGTSATIKAEKIATGLVDSSSNVPNGAEYDYQVELKATKDNTLTLNNVYADNGRGEFELAAGKINVNNSTFDSGTVTVVAGNNTKWTPKLVKILSEYDHSSPYMDDQDQVDLSATANNTINVNNSKIAQRGNFIYDFSAYGGKINFINSSIDGNEISLVAGNTIGGVHTDNKAMTITAAKDNSLTLSNTSISGAGNVSLGGGSVAITGDKSIKGTDVSIIAGTKLATVPDPESETWNDDIDTIHFTANADSNINIGSNTLSGSYYRIAGGNVTLKGTKINEPNAINLYALSSYNYNEKNNEAGTDYAEIKEDMSATSANQLSLQNANITTKGDIELTGGAVNIHGSTITEDGSKDIELSALKTWNASYMEDGEPEIYKADSDNTLTVDNSTVSMTSGRAYLYGGNVNLTGANTVKAGDTYILAGSSATNKFASDSDDGDVTDFTATSANTVSLGKSNIETPYIDIQGGKVNLDGTQITSQGDVGIYAGTKMTHTEFSGGKDNTITVANGSKISSVDDDIEFIGGAINLTDSTLENTNDDIFLTAINTGKIQYENVQKDGNNHVIETDTDTADAGNAIIINNSKLTAAQGVANLIGGKIALQGTTNLSAKGYNVAAGKNISIKYDQLNEKTDTDSVTATGTTTTDGSKMLTKDSTVTLTGTAKFAGVETAFTDNSTTPTKPDTPVTPTKPDDKPVTPTKPDTPVTPTKPDDKPVTPDAPTISEDMKQNVANGRAAMNKLFEKNSTPAARSAAVSELSRQVRQSHGDRDARAAQLVGFIEAIGASNLDQTERTSLMHAVTQDIDAHDDADRTAEAARTAIQDTVAELTSTAPAATEASASAEETAVTVE